MRQQNFFEQRNAHVRVNCPLVRNGGDACGHGVIQRLLDAEAAERGIQHRGGKRIARAGGVDHFRRPQFAAQDRAGIIHVQTALRAEGAVPATTAIMGGKLKVGLNAEELLVMCKAEGVGKVSRRDVAVYLATGMTGATTVATTMIIASMAGIRFFATGGIGGVHRGAEKTMDISADLQELANTPVCVVCAGAKSILDLGLTLEYLETQGVPVLGLRTDELPAFYCRTSGFKLDYNCQDEETVAKIMKAKWDIGLKGGAVVGNPIPEQYAMDPNYMNGIIDQAVAQANAEHIHGKAITPYLLAHIKDMTEGKSFAANLELAYNNAHAASKIAVAYTKL